MLYTYILVASLFIIIIYIYYYSSCYLLSISNYTYYIICTKRLQKVPTVPANCSKPTTGLLNGKLTPSTDIASGANFTLTCNHGSVLTGPATINCSDGTLSSPSGCMPVASFAQDFTDSGTFKALRDILHSPDKAIDNDPSTYAWLASRGPWNGEIPTAGLKVYFKAIVEVESVTFTAYCFSDEDQFTVSMVYKDEDNFRSCGSSRCDSYGELKQGQHAS